MSIRSLKQVRHLAGKRVLVRVDYNVPIKKGRVTDDMRLLASLPTLRYLIDNKAKVILVTHLGRPEGKIVPTLTVDPLAKRLRQLLDGLPVQKIDTKNWELTFDQKERVFLRINAMAPGDVAMLENIRFSPHEEQDMEMLSRELASIADLFVFDAFAVAHHASASVSGVARYLPSYMGLLVDKEMKGLKRMLSRPIPPFVAIIGGIKMETKIPVLQHVLPIVDHILIGGAMMNTYLAGSGYRVGNSLIDVAYTKEAMQYGKKRKVVLPIDVIVGSEDGAHYRHVIIEKKPHRICKKDEAILDIGPATIRLFASYIMSAQTLLWNGAMGHFEQKPYHVGTHAIARLIASRAKGKAYGVVGGGETVESLHQVGMSEYVDLVSTGGGAMLEFIAGNTLPGITALDRK